MGRLPKGIWVFNDPSGEYDGPWIEDQVTKNEEPRSTSGLAEPRACRRIRGSARR